MMASKVIVAGPDLRALEALTRDMRDVGIHVLGADDGSNLVRECIRLAPEALVWWEDWLTVRSLDHLRLLAQTHPLPTLVYTLEDDVRRLEAAVEAGVQGYVVNGYASARLRSDLAAACARFRREHALLRALEELSHKHEERKLIDRAKGVLMRATQMSEEEAFRWLRTASMRQHRRVGQVSRVLVEAAARAHAINRAGLLRMLSQRYVLVSAAGCAGTSAVAQGALQTVTDTVAQVLSELQRSEVVHPYRDLVGAAAEQWARVVAVQAQGADLWPQLDEAAERLLEAAERLTGCLEAAWPEGRLNVVNLCARQRMLAQRYGKQMALAALGQADAVASAAAAAPTRAQFEAALDALRQTPLTSERVRELLAQAARTWRVLLAACHGSPPAWDGLMGAADELVSVFDALTQQYEQEVHRLIG